MSREKPILFSGPMVRAILDGRKTQTRRLFTHRHAGAIDYIGPSGEEHDPSNWGYFFDGPDHHGYMVLGRGHDERQDHGRISIPCPYGETGDRLWVRETWAPVDFLADSVAREEPMVVGYRADLAAHEHDHRGATRRVDTFAWNWDMVTRWKPSIHMPRWASRITLEVTNVRVQRLHDISEEDARAEGVESVPFCKAGRPEGLNHVEAFEDLWDQINGKPPGRRARRRAAGEERERNRVLGSWASNPWVWAVTFAVAQPEAK